MNLRIPHAAIVFVFSWVLFTWGIHLSSIYILDESKNAQCAWEMMNQGDGLVPQFNLEMRTDKPPLHYYFMQIAYSIAGKNAAAARFFSAFLGALLMWGIFRFVGKEMNRTIAWSTVAVLWASAHWVIEFHLAVPDPYLLTFSTFSLILFYENVQKPTTFKIMGMYACVALAVLSKGPVAIVLPGLVAVLYLVSTRNFTIKLLKKLFHPAGIAIFLLLAIPWYVAVALKTNGVWLKGFLWEHNFDRFSSEKEGHGGWFVLTLVYYLIGFIPFLFFIPYMLKQTFQNRKEPLILFSTIATVVYLLFFALSSTKLPNYAMPAFPFTAILWGTFFHQALHHNSLQKSWPHLANAILLTALTVAIALLPRFDSAWHSIRHPYLALIPLCAGTWVAWYRSRHRFGQSIVIVIAGSVVTNIALTGFLLPEIDRTNPVRVSAHLFEHKPQIAYYQSLNPAFVFQYGPIPRLEPAEVDSFLSQPNHLLLTTGKGLENHSVWSHYPIVFSCTDLFDNRKTVILRSIPKGESDTIHSSICK